MTTFQNKLKAIKESKQFNVGVLFLFSGIIIWNMTQLIENSHDDRFRIASLLSSGRVCNVDWNPLDKINIKNFNEFNEKKSNLAYEAEVEIDDFLLQSQIKDREPGKRIIIRDHGSHQRIYEVVTNFTSNDELYERVKEIESLNHENFVNEGQSTKYDFPLPIGTINHISIDTFDLEKSISFYTGVLGFEILPNRPNFPFGGAWLIKKPPTKPNFINRSWVDFFTNLFYKATDEHNESSFVLHISVYDPEFEDYRRIHRKSEEKAISVAHERYMRRGRHVAFSVASKEAILEAEIKLQNKGISYTKFIVPNTENKVIQLFFFDPDFNGIEIGNYLL